MVRVGTFNVENLFARYRFKQNLNPEGLDGFSINDLAFDIYDETEKQITAQAIKEIDADILALQEVESLPLLDRFSSQYLASMKYKHRIVVDSFDPRSIDVALLSRHPIVKVRSNRQERNANNTTWLFSRDCLEVELDVAGKKLTLYVNHFKSMIRTRAETKARREAQVKRVAEIVDEQWRAQNYEGNFVVLGDFNDYAGVGTSLTALLDGHQGLVDVVAKRLPADEQWTHYYAGGGKYSQLDYLLVSKTLADANNSAPVIMRKGLPWRAEKYDGERYGTVGHDNPKASDHCPLAIDLELP
jgi:endonuclease/exonuclease/phosphatase family metal-dependent hydrolase